MSFQKNRLWRMGRWFLIPLGFLVVGGLIFQFMVMGLRLDDADLSHVPRFLQHDIMDIDHIYSISKFRSGVGHDYSAWGEPCRSMKHYYQSYAGGLSEYQTQHRPDNAHAQTIYSPVDGRMYISATGEGDHQLNIFSDHAPGYDVRLEHVWALQSLHNFSHVRAGQVIATIWDGKTVDVSIQYNTIHGTRLLPYSYAMPDSMFATYQARGVTSRDDFVISKAYRDAHPLKCLNNRPGTPDFDPDNYRGQETLFEQENFLHLSGWVNHVDDSAIKAGAIKDFYSCAQVTNIIEQGDLDSCRGPNGQLFKRPQG